MKNVFFVIAIFYAINLNSQTNLSYYFGDNINFDESIPKPSEIIGHEVGEWHVTHDKLVQYMYIYCTQAYFDISRWNPIIIHSLSLIKD